MSAYTVCERNIKTCVVCTLNVHRHFFFNSFYISFFFFFITFHIHYAFNMPEFVWPMFYRVLVQFVLKLHLSTILFIIHRCVFYHLNTVSSMITMNVQTYNIHTHTATQNTFAFSTKRNTHH